MIEFSYKLVGTGWSEARIADGQAHATLTASYLSNALGDLLAALVLLNKGADEAEFSWEEEPGEYTWLFRRAGSDASLSIRWFEDQHRRVADDPGRVVFETKQPLAALTAAIAHGAATLLAEVGERGYAEKWYEHPFPTRELEELTRPRTT